MEVTAYIAAYTKSNGKPDQSSQCAILLEADTGAKRTIIQFLGGKSQPQAEIYTAIAALTAIRSRDTKVTLVSTSTYLVKLLTKKNGEWGEVKSNKGLVAKLRETYDAFRDCTVVFNNTDDLVKQVAGLAKSGWAEQLNSDSGTQYDSELNTPEVVAHNEPRAQITIRRATITMPEA